MIKALIFDMDGTLADSERVHYEAWKEALAGQGVKSFLFEEFVVYVGTSNEKVAEDYISSAGLKINVEELVREKQVIYLEMIPDIRLLPGVKRIINRYHGRYRLAVASSSHRIELGKILETHDLSQCFEQIVGGDMVSRKKPDPEIYLTARDLLGLKSSECVAFEDSESGINAARDAGMFSIAIPHSLSKHHNFDRADHVVERIDLVNDALLQSIKENIE